MPARRSAPISANAPSVVASSDERAPPSFPEGVRAALEQAIKGLGIDSAAISIELEYAPDPDRIEDWVREVYEATAKLMRAAGLRA